MPHPIYLLDHNNAIYKIGLSYEWSSALNDATGNYTTTFGNLKLFFKRVHGIYLISMESDWSDPKKLEMFKSCSVNVLGGCVLAIGKVVFAGLNKTPQHVISFPESQLKARDGKYYVEFHISSKEFSTSLPVPAALPTHMETILECMYEDTTYGDVSFIFDCDTGPQSTPQRSRKRGRKPVAKKHPRRVLHAHKLVLSQWPYFKAMFEGGFAESRSEDVQIHIKDIRPETFELLLRFMYTFKLPEDLNPQIIYADAVQFEGDVSREELFLAADRYDVQELRELMLTLLLANLNSTDAIPFLFRCAYMFPELREPVVKFVVKSCGSTIFKKNIRNTYKDHPDVLDIVMDLLEVSNAPQS